MFVRTTSPGEVADVTVFVQFSYTLGSTGVKCFWKINNLEKQRKKTNGQYAHSLPHTQIKGARLYLDFPRGTNKATLSPNAFALWCEVFFLLNTFTPYALLQWVGEKWGTWVGKEITISHQCQVSEFPCQFMSIIKQ